MTLTGTRLGSYEIVAPLGAGGMGEVYRARDWKLNRDVAIKVLPGLFATDPDRLARFTREAQVLASLNHPNVAAIYGVVDPPAEAGSHGALVMELVDGEDLSAIIARGPLPLREALPIARQIADALEAAHEQGIVHRDLKPANIKVKADGTVKVLDFGLAKAIDPAGASSAEAMNSPTLTVRATQIGMIVGTAAYMAPEQARGKAVDRRADIWAFGTVLYEMLTGRRAFEADDISDVLAAVLRQDVDFTALPADTPPAMRRLLRRCLEKDAKQRLSAIGDARLELDEREAAPEREPAKPPRGSVAWRIWPALVVFVATAGTAALLWYTSVPAGGERGTARFSLLPPPGAALYPDATGIAISPDGSKVAFLTGNSYGASGGALWVRDLESLTARELEDTSGASMPFWSPDSQRIGFFSPDGTLKVIPVTGGKPDVLCPAASARGAAWSSSGVIVFAPEATGPLYRVDANGGTATPATRLDAGRKHSGHRFPAMLPDGDHFLYAALPSRNGQFEIFAGSLSSSETAVPVGVMESAPVYAEPGWLLHSRQGVLMAQAFDARSLTLKGDAVRLGDEPGVIMESQNSRTAARVTSVSATGSLAYYSPPSINTQAIVVSIAGQVTGAVRLPPGHYETLRIAPDGKRAALVRSTTAAESQVWLADLAQGGAVPWTSGPGRHDDPVWSPDGSRLAFTENAEGPADIYARRVDDTSPPESLLRSTMLFKNPVAWSADGRWIVFNQVDPGTAQDIWLLPLPVGPPPKPFVLQPGTDRSGDPSPDGHWIHYVANETGRTELYVQSFPEPGRRIQVSHEGAEKGWWSRDGRQILFTDIPSAVLWAVDVAPGPSLSVGTPRRIATLPPNILYMDAMPDRQSFVALVPERAGPGSVTVVRNWRAALDARSGR